MKRCLSAVAAICFGVMMFSVNVAQAGVSDAKGKIQDKSKVQEVGNPNAIGSMGTADEKAPPKPDGYNIGGTIKASAKAAKLIGKKNCSDIVVTIPDKGGSNSKHASGGLIEGGCTYHKHFGKGKCPDGLTVAADYPSTLVTNAGGGFAGIHAEGKTASGKCVVDLTLDAKYIN